MSNTISNISLNEIHDVSQLIMEEDIIIDLTKLVLEYSKNITLGYYFADKLDIIITGKVINYKIINLRMSKTWITIPFQDIPQNAATLSFFVD